MGDILDLSERYWHGEILPCDMWRPTGKSEELAAGVFFFHAWANVTAIRTGPGLLLADALMTHGIFDSTARDSATKAARSPEHAPGPARGPGERQP